MSGLHNEIVLRDDIDNPHCFHAEACHRATRLRRSFLISGTNLRAGVEGRHPDDEASVNGNPCHIFYCGRIHPADRQIKIDTTEDFDTAGTVANHISDDVLGIRLTREFRACGLPSRFGRLPLPLPVTFKTDLAGRTMKATAK